MSQVTTAGSAAGSTFRAWVRATSGRRTLYFRLYFRSRRLGATNAQRATTWSNGLSMNGLVGFDASSTAGYSGREKLKNVIPDRRRICGTNRYPADHPSRVVVKP